MNPHHGNPIATFTSKERAQEISNSLNLLLEEGGPHPGHMDVRRKVVSYEPRGYSFQSYHQTGNDHTVREWGIWARWGYVDRPDLPPHFGGPFVYSCELESYLPQ